MAVDIALAAVPQWSPFQPPLSLPSLAAWLPRNKRASEAAEGNTGTRKRAPRAFLPIPFEADGNERSIYTKYAWIEHEHTIMPAEGAQYQTRRGHRPPRTPPAYGAYQHNAQGGGGISKP